MKHFVMTMEHEKDSFTIVDLLCVCDDVIDAFEYLFSVDTSEGLLYVEMREDGVLYEYTAGAPMRDNFRYCGNILLKIQNPELLLEHYIDTLKDFSHISCNQYLCEILKIVDGEIVFESELDTRYYEFIKQHNLLIEKGMLPCHHTQE